MASCTEKGTTSACPPLPRYQTYPLGDASPADATSADSSDTQAALATARDAGCVTTPTLFPFDASAGDDGAGGNSSGGAHAGSGGAHAGSGGASAGAGGSAGNHGGAAGAN